MRKSFLFILFLILASGIVSATTELVWTNTRTITLSANTPNQVPFCAYDASSDMFAIASYQQVQRYNMSGTNKNSYISPNAYVFTITYDPVSTHYFISREDSQVTASNPIVELSNNLTFITNRSTPTVIGIDDWAAYDTVNNYLYGFRAAALYYINLTTNTSNTGTTLPYVRTDSIEFFPGSNDTLLRYDNTNKKFLVYNFSIGGSTLYRTYTFPGITTTASTTACPVNMTRILTARGTNNANVDVWDATANDVPVVTILSPATNTNITNGLGWVYFNFTDSDNFNQTCYVNVNSVIRGTQTNATNNTNYNLSFTVKDNGVNGLVVNVSCGDGISQAQGVSNSILQNASFHTDLYGCAELPLSNKVYTIMSNISETSLLAERACFKMWGNNQTLYGNGFLVNATGSTAATNEMIYINGTNSKVIGYSSVQPDGSSNNPRFITLEGNANNFTLFNSTYRKQVTGTSQGAGIQMTAYGANGYINISNSQILMYLPAIGTGYVFNPAGLGTTTKLYMDNVNFSNRAAGWLNPPPNMFATGSKVDNIRLDPVGHSSNGQACWLGWAATWTNIYCNNTLAVTNDASVAGSGGVTNIIKNWSNSNPSKGLYPQNGAYTSNITMGGYNRTRSTWTAPGGGTVTTHEFVSFLIYVNYTNGTAASNVNVSITPNGLATIYNSTGANGYSPVLEALDAKTTGTTVLATTYYDNMTINATDGINTVSTSVNTSLVWFQNITLTLPLDTTPPNITINYPEENHRYNDYSGYINITTNEVVSNCTVISAGSWVYTYSNGTFFSFMNNSAVIDALWNINVSCWDSAGNNGSALRSFYVDITPPDVNLLNESFITNNDYFNLYFNSTEGLTTGLNCSLYLDNTLYNSTRFWVWMGSAVYISASSIPDGNYTVNLTCTDDTGNLGYNDSNWVSIDTVAPVITYQYPSNGSYYNNYNGYINISISEAASCSINNSLWTYNPSSVYSSTSMCYQETANVSTSCGGLATGKYGLNGTWNTNSYLMYDGVWGGESYSSTTSDGWFFINYTKPLGALPSSKWKIEYGAFEIGNYSIPSDCWNYDSNKLIFAMESHNMAPVWDARIFCYNSTWHQLGSGSPNWFIVFEDAMWWNISQSTIYSFINTTAIPDNTYSINATCMDSVSNTGSQSIYFTIDTTLPTVTITLPLNTSYSTNVSELDFNAHDTNLQACWYSLNNGTTNTSIACTSNINAFIYNLNSTEGYNTWTVYVNDSAGNKNQTNVTFFKDTIAPIVSYLNISYNGTYADTVIILENVTYTETNFKNISFYLYDNLGILVYNSSSTNSTGPYNLTMTVPAYGSYSFNSTVYDSVGNHGTSSTQYITLSQTVVGGSSGSTISNGNWVMDIPPMISERAAVTNIDLTKTKNSIIPYIFLGYLIVILGIGSKKEKPKDLNKPKK